MTESGPVAKKQRRSRVRGADQLVYPEWERQPGETDLAFARFAAYRDLGEARNHKGVAIQFNVGVNMIAALSRRWGWADRIRCLDHNLEARRQAAFDRASASDARRWVERRAAKRERDYQIADLLTKRAVQMLQFPLVETSEETTGIETTELGEVHVHKRIVIKPYKWNAGNIPALLSAADALASRALDAVDVEADEQATERVIADMARRSGLSPALLLEMSAEMARERRAILEGAAEEIEAADGLSRPIEGDYDLDED